VNPGLLHRTGRSDRHAGGCHKNLGPGRQIVSQDSRSGVSRIGGQAGTQATDPTPASPQNRASRAGSTIHSLPAESGRPGGQSLLHMRTYRSPWPVRARSVHFRSCRNTQIGYRRQVSERSSLGAEPTPDCGAELASGQRPDLYLLHPHQARREGPRGDRPGSAAPGRLALAGRRRRCGKVSSHDHYSQPGPAGSLDMCPAPGTGQAAGRDMYRMTQPGLLWASVRRRRITSATLPGDAT